MSELPVFVKGKRYVVFLRNTLWNVSAVVADLALRVDSVDGVEVLVNTEGHPVTEVNYRGPVFGARLFESISVDGTAPKPLKDLPQAGGVKMLDRRAFVDALGARLSAQGLRISGSSFFDRPAGAFKWRGMPVVPHGEAEPQSGPTEGPEIDTTRPSSEQEKNK